MLNLLHPTRVSDVVDIFNTSRLDISVGVAAVQTAPLNAGTYDVWCDVDVYLKVNLTANDVTVASGYLLRGNNTVTLGVRQDARIGAITSTAAGTLSIHLVGG